MQERESKAERFAWSMRKIPTRVIRDEVYADVKHVIVDKRHATNIILKVVPTATSVDLYDALAVLQHRLDEKYEARR